MASSSFGWGGFALRFVFALLLVLLTYNPEGWSFVHWVSRDVSHMIALKALAGVLLAVGWTIYIRATLRSLGPVGMVLTLALFGSLVWVMIDFNLVNMQSMRVVSYLAIFVIAAVMAVGISWSHVRRRLSGQIDADDVDE